MNVLLGDNRETSGGILYFKEAEKICLDSKDSKV